MNITGYNQIVRGIACANSAEFGIDTPKHRRHKAYWIRRIRKEFPMSQFGITWGVGG